MTISNPGQRPDRAVLGALLIIGSVFLMSLQDAIIKYASTDLPLWQIYVLRSVIAIPGIFTLVAARSRISEPLFRSFGRWTLLRSLFLVMMYLCIYASVPVLDLSTIAAAFYTAPLFITLLSALLIGEPVSWRGWLAIALGFLGVLIILQPGTNAFRAIAVLPVFAGLSYAFAAIITRSKCSNEAPATLALSLNLALLITGVMASLVILLWYPTQAQIEVYPFLFKNWVRLWILEWALISLLAVLIVGIGVGLAAAYQAAPPVIISAFDYSYLIFATVWGYVIFSETPDTYSLVGMLFISGAGFLIVAGQFSWGR